MKVAKWGNSLAVRLPKSLVESLQLKADDDIQLVPAGDQTFSVSRTPDRLEFLRRIRQYRGLMPEGFKFDRDEANSRD